MTTFGDVPPDAIAARYDTDKPMRERIVRGLRAMTKGWDDREIIGDIFGANDFDVPKRAAYEELRQSVYRAYKRGILEGSVVMDATLSVAATQERRAIPPDPPDATQAPAATETEAQALRGRHGLEQNLLPPAGAELRAPSRSRRAPRRRTPRSRSRSGRRAA